MARLLTVLLLCLLPGWLEAAPTRATLPYDTTTVAAGSLFEVNGRIDADTLIAPVRDLTGLRDSIGVVIGDSSAAAEIAALRDSVGAILADSTHASEVAALRDSVGLILADSAVAAEVASLRDSVGAVLADSTVAAEVQGLRDSVDAVLTDSLRAGRVAVLRDSAAAVARDTVEGGSFTTAGTWTFGVAPVFSAGASVNGTAALQVLTTSGLYTANGGLTLPAGQTLTGAAGSVVDVTAVTPDSILGNFKATGTPVFSGGFSVLSANINSGTIDGVTIGGASAGAATVTTLTATGNVALGNGATDTTTVTGLLRSGAVTGAVTAPDLTVDPTGGAAQVIVGRLSGTGGDNTTFLVRNRVGTPILSTSGATPVSVQSHGQLRVKPGTAAAPSIVDSTDSNTGVNWLGNDTLALGVAGAEGLRLVPGNKLGLGTATVPHGGVGMALLALEGADASTGGPHIQLTTAADDYPLLQILAWQHDSINLAFDCYYDGTNTRSSDAGSNFYFRKSGDIFALYSKAGVAQGGIVTGEATGLVQTAAGNVGVGAVPPATGTNFTGLYLGGNTSWTAQTAAGASKHFFLAQNAYWSSSNTWKYISTDEASRYTQTAGTHAFDVVGSGTAGDDITTWITGLTITAAGQNLIGTATASANAAGPSLLVAQGANDDGAVVLSSTDVAHAMTAVTDAANYFRLRKVEATSGGAYLSGFKDADGSAGYAVYLEGVLGEAANTTKTTAGIGVIHLSSNITDGSTGTAVVGSDGNLVTIANASTTRFIFDAEGSAHADVEWASYQTEDDLAMVHDLEAAFLPRQFGEALVYAREDLERHGIVGKGSWGVNPETGRTHAMINWTRLSQLHHGAIGKLGTEVDGLDYRLAGVEQWQGSMEGRMAALESGAVLTKSEPTWGDVANLIWRML